MVVVLWQLRGTLGHDCRAVAVAIAIAIAIVAIIAVVTAMCTLLFLSVCVCGVFRNRELSEDRMEWDETRVTYNTMVHMYRFCLLIRHRHVQLDRSIGHHAYWTVMGVCVSGRWPLSWIE